MERQIKYPCRRCKRVADPVNCENKRCALWNRWFLQRWRGIHGWYQKYGGCHELEG